MDSESDEDPKNFLPKQEDPVKKSEMMLSKLENNDMEQSIMIEESVDLDEVIDSFEQPKLN